MNILVLCTGNSARSILLEAVLNRSGDKRLRAWSAGSRPAGRVHPEAIRLLNRTGYETSGLRSKSWDEFAAPDAPVMDAVITVCGSAAGETCPVWPGSPLRAHWGVEDPAAAPEDAWEPAFAEAFATLKHRAVMFLALPFEVMDRDELSEALDRIGRMP